MWDPPRPGLEPVSPALAGGFLTTVPQGMSPARGIFVAVRGLLIEVVSLVAECGL